MLYTPRFRYNLPFFVIGFFLLVASICLTLYAVFGSHGNLEGWRRVPLVRGGGETHTGLTAYFVKWNASDLSQDNRGWLLDPVAASIRAGVIGGATTCKSVHVGQIKPGTVRGNHRHLYCNESFVIWGAKTKFRLESRSMKRGYVEVIIGEEEVAIVGGPAGLAHAVSNIDDDKITHFIGCQDALVNAKDQRTEYNIWRNI